MNEENITLSGISSGDISGSAEQEDSLSGSITEESISGNLSDDSLSGDIKSESEMNGNLNIGGSASKKEVYEIIEEYLEENPVEAVSDYPDLTNKPKINDVELEGNKTLQELGIQPEGDYASRDDIPTKNSQLENDSGYLTEHQDLSSYALKTEIPQVPSWAMQNAKPTYTAAEVGADPAGSAGNALAQANSALSTHNTSTDAHNDIRLFLIDIANRLNALANSDDETLDQMNEVVAYIKDNRELIEQITTNKVNVADIIDNLTTNVSNKPLSAAQGVALKTLFDNLPSWSKEATKPKYTASEVGAEPSGTAEIKVAEHNSSSTAHGDIRQAVADIKIPTKVSELENDKHYLTEHQSLDGYATESWVEGKGYLTEHQSLEEYSKTSDMLQLVYPVGAVYISTVATNPSVLFGFGTWEQIQDMFLLAASSTYTAGSTGGTATHSHEYRLGVKTYYGSPIGSDSDMFQSYDYETGTNKDAERDGNADNPKINKGLQGGQNDLGTTCYQQKIVGNTKTETNLPPYLAVYMWKRTA